MGPRLHTLPRSPAERSGFVRDAHITEAQEADDTSPLLSKKSVATPGAAVNLFLAAKPAETRIEAWIVKDAQGLDTRVDLIDVSATDEPDARLFNPAAR